MTGYRKVRRIPVQREVSGEFLGSAAGRVIVSIGTPGNRDRVLGPLQLLDMPTRGRHSLAFPIIHLGDVVQVVVIDEQVIRPSRTALVADVGNNGFVPAIAVDIRVGALRRIVLIQLQARRGDVEKHPGLKMLWQLATFQVARLVIAQRRHPQGIEGLYRDYFIFPTTLGILVCIVFIFSRCGFGGGFYCWGARGRGLSLGFSIGRGRRRGARGGAGEIRLIRGPGGLRGIGTPTQGGDGGRREDDKRER